MIVLDASAAVVDLGLVRHALLPFLPRLWDLRASLSAADAAYVALAEALGATLVTLDGRLARAAGVRARVVSP